MLYVYLLFIFILGTIFAYGQTSSGKSHTMMGEHNGIVEGIVHYTISDIFESIQDVSTSRHLIILKKKYNRISVLIAFGDFSYIPVSDIKYRYLPIYLSYLHSKQF